VWAVSTNPAEMVELIEMPFGGGGGAGQTCKGQMHCWKAYEICYKSLMILLTLHVLLATLPWEIKHSNFLQM